MSEIRTVTCKPSSDVTWRGKVGSQGVSRNQILVIEVLHNAVSAGC